MSLHTAEVTWSRGSSAFLDSKYSRVHRWSFDGGATIPASSSPHVVPAPYADPACVDPEEAFVAALSSCHMLFFLSLAAKAGFVVDTYLDQAEAAMEKNGEGKLAITRVMLKPVIKFSGDSRPTQEHVDKLHHNAHESCFLATSVKTDIGVSGSWTHRR